MKRIAATLAILFILFGAVGPTYAQSDQCTTALNRYAYWSNQYNTYMWLWAISGWDWYFADLAMDAQHEMGQWGNLIDIYCNGAQQE